MSNNNNSISSSDNPNTGTTTFPSFCIRQEGGADGSRVYSSGDGSTAVVANGFCVGTIPLIGTNAIGSARTIISVSKNKFLIVDRAINSVVIVQLTTSNGTATGSTNDSDPNSWFSQILVSAPGLNHALALYNNFIYASSDEYVYRWQYTENNNITTIIGEMEQVIYNMNSNGIVATPDSNNTTRTGHSTRTLVFDNIGRLYISVGSIDNVDSDSFRSRVRRFIIDNSTISNNNIDDKNNNNIDTTISLPIDFVTGEVYADGVRNEVGLAFDPLGVLWGVENGADKLYREELGGDISADNPAEELHRFDEDMVGSHYGYPYCFTEYMIPNGYGLGKGTVWAWPSFVSSSAGMNITDTICRTNYKPAALPMQGHSAPLGITFYKYNDQRPDSCIDIQPFPKDMDGYAFIAFHGSWNRDVPTGYKVVYVPMPLNDTIIATGPIDILTHIPPNAQWDDDGFRPVDVDFDECGRLLVSSDGNRNQDTGLYIGSKIVRIEKIDGNFNTVSPSTYNNTTTSTDVPSHVPTPQAVTSRPPTIQPSSSSSASYSDPSIDITTSLTTHTYIPTQYFSSIPVSLLPTTTPTIISTTSLPVQLPSSIPMQTIVTEPLLPTVDPTMTLSPKSIPPTSNAQSYVCYDSVQSSITILCLIVYLTLL